MRIKSKTVKITAVSLSSVLASVILIWLSLCFICAYKETSTSGNLPVFQKLSISMEKLCTTSINDMSVKIRYLLTKTVDSNGIISKSNGFLFPTENNGFDYKADYTGENTYNEQACQRILESITLRKNVYAADGAEYYIFIIPNSQSVYGEYTPWKKTEGLTKAETLVNYCSNAGFDSIYLADLNPEKDALPSFNNTENTINAYGAYLLYRYTAERMPEMLAKRSSIHNLSYTDFACFETAGLSLASSLNLEKTIKNRTVSFASGNLTDMYSSVPSDSGSVKLYKLNDRYNPYIGTSPILFEIPYITEAELLKTLFSSTYTNTAYKSSFDYSASAINASKPYAVVSFVREDDLNSLTDDYTEFTYAKRLESDGEATTKEVKIVCTAPTFDGCVLVAGECENGSTVMCRTSVGTAYQTVSRYGRFMMALNISTPTVAKFTAQVGGKAVSETVTLSLKPAGIGSKTVFVGNNSFLYYSETLAEYTGSNLYSESKLSVIKKVMTNRSTRLDRYAGKPVQQILLIAPDPLTVYPDIASEAHASVRSETTVYDQIVKLFDGCEQITVLDIRKLMTDNTDIGKLYHQTDTHWTELGAYFGYYALINEISKKFPVSPYPLLDSFNIEMKKVAAGDLAGFIGLKDFTEYVPCLTPEFPLLSRPEYIKPSTIDRSGLVAPFETYVDDAALPKAIMIRDSYSAQLFPFVSEHFNILSCQAMWGFAPDYNLVEKVKPDYIIYVFCERNLISLFSL